MSRRTRKTFQGMKTRFTKPRSKNGPIKRIVGDMPMKSLDDAAFETLVKERSGVDDGRFQAALKHSKVRDS